MNGNSRKFREKPFRATFVFAKSRARPAIMDFIKYGKPLAGYRTRKGYSANRAAASLSQRIG